MHTYVFPFAGDPGVTCTFCSLARPGDGGALASIAQVLSDPSTAFQSAVNISVLNSDSTGDRTLVKQTQSTQLIEKKAANGNSIYGIHVCSILTILF